MHSGANFSVPLALEPSIIRGGFFLFSRGLCPQTPSVSFMVVSLAVGHRFLKFQVSYHFLSRKKRKKKFQKNKKKISRKFFRNFKKINFLFREIKNFFFRKNLNFARKRKKLLNYSFYFRIFSDICSVVG